MARSIGGSSWFAFKCLTPFVILFGLGVAVLYVRLLNGPISLKFLAAPIARSIAAELPGIKVVIEDALVRVTNSGSVEFRIRNIRFNDAEGAPIALAPLAAVSMSTSALWSGRLAPDKVVLIEPRLLLSYTEAGGLSVRFTRTGESSKAQDRLPGSRPAAATPAGGSDGKPEDDDAVAVAQRVDIARLIAEAGQRARRGADATSFLREIGVRNATVILDRSGTQSAWTVIEADVDLEHKKKRSTVTGTMTLASTSGPWGLSFKIEEAEKSASVSLEATVRDLVPRGLAAMLPELAFSRRSTRRSTATPGSTCRSTAGLPAVARNSISAAAHCECPAPMNGKYRSKAAISTCGSTPPTGAWSSRRRHCAGTRAG